MDTILQDFIPVCDRKNIRLRNKGIYYHSTPNDSFGKLARKLAHRDITTDIKSSKLETINYLTNDVLIRNMKNILDDFERLNLHIYEYDGFMSGGDFIYFHNERLT